MTGGAGTSSSNSVPFNDAGGTVSASAGTLSPAGGGSLAGTKLSPAAGATVRLDGGTFTLGGTATASGGGTVLVGGGTATVAAGGSATLAGSDGTTLAVGYVSNGYAYGGDLNAAAGATLTLKLSGASSVVLNSYGTVGDGAGAGAGAVVNAGNFNWSGGSIGASGGGGGLTNTGTLAVTGGGGLYGTLANNGTITHGGGGFYAEGGGVLANAAGAVYDFTADGTSIYNGGGSVAAAVTNAGLFEKTAGAGTSTVSVAFNNLVGGTVTPFSGTLYLSGGLVNAGTITVPVGSGLSVSGTLQQSLGGTFTSAGRFAAGGFVNAGGTATFGGTQQWSYGSTINNSGGSATFTTDPGTALSVLVAGGTVTFASTDHPAAVNVSAGAAAVVANAAGGGRSLLVTPSLTLAGTAGAWTGKLDLMGDDLDVPNGSLATLSSEAAEGFAGGTWNGSGGIVGSTAAADSRHLTAVGVIQSATTIGGATPIYTTFDGQSVSATDVLARYTYYGDANLDGVVNAADYARIDAGYVQHLTGWQSGDFNYDGVVDGSDYTLSDNAFNQQSGDFAAPAVAVAAVPEPAAAGLLAVATAAAVGRRRRRGGHRGSRRACVGGQ